MPNKYNDPDYVLETKKLTEKEKKLDAQEMPVYLTPLKLTEGQDKYVLKEIKDEFQAQKDEREQKQLEEKWDGLDSQYAAEMEEDPDRQYNLCLPSSKIKGRGIARLIGQAYYEAEPRYNISPRPEFAKEGGGDVCEKQTDFLDYKLDTEIEYEKVKRKVLKSAVVKGTGIEKIYHKILRQKRKRDEKYEGQDGLKLFLEKYKDAETKYKGYVNRLREGKTINIVAEYTETLKNDPMPKFVDLKNFYCRLDTDGYSGLCEAKLLVERVSYYWWELKAEEDKGNFYNIDMLKQKKDKNGDYVETTGGFKNEKFDILECTYYGKLEEDDKDEVKIICWVAEDRDIIIGAIYYPFEGIDCIYNPHYVIEEEEGFYQPGILEDLTALNIYENEFLNFGLEGVYMSNMVTPITPRDSDIDSQFLSKTWAHGIPLNIGQEEKVDFLQRYMKPTNLNDIIVVMEVLSRTRDDISGHSGLLTGRESELDPQAPASKTAALLRVSGLSIKDYVKCVLPAFNRTASIMLQMYYQISKEGRKYKMSVERKNVVGGGLFDTISREEMIARTNIQSQALAFDYDKVNEKRIDLALYQLLRPEVAQDPEAVVYLLRVLVKGWSSKWKNVVDRVLPTIEETKQKEAMVALNAVGNYIQVKQKESEMTGKPPDLNVQELMPMINDLRRQITTPLTPEEKKQREKDADKG